MYVHHRLTEHLDATSIVARDSQARDSLAEADVECCNTHSVTVSRRFTQIARSSKDISDSQMGMIGTRASKLITAADKYDGPHNCVPTVIHHVLLEAT